MDLEIIIEPATGWARVEPRGDLDLDGCRRALRSAWAHPQYRTAAAALWSLAGVRADLRFDGLVQLTHWIERHGQGRGARAVALVAPDAVTFGVARMFCSLQAQSVCTLGVFRGREAAVAWLQTLQSSRPCGAARPEGLAAHG